MGLNAAAVVPLVMPVFAAAALTVRRLAFGYGTYFLPQGLGELLGGQWLEVLSALALALFLLLHRERAFWRVLGRITVWSVGTLAVLGLLSHLRGGYLASYLSGLVPQLSAGAWSGALYWLIWWLVLVCAALSAWELTRFLARTQGEARSLALKNQLVMDNYRTLEGRLRETARLRHGFGHQLTALSAMIRARDWEGLDRWAAARQAESGDPVCWTEHIAVNAILQDAADRAKAAGVTFHASAVVPKALFVPDEDLCALLMNLLDNALEGRPARRRGGRSPSSSRSGWRAASCPFCVRTPLTAGWRRMSGGIRPPPRRTRRPTASA